MTTLCQQHFSYNKKIGHSSTYLYAVSGTIALFRAYESKNGGTMHASLLLIHSILRWLVLLGLLYTIIRGISGWSGRRTFTRSDDTARHVTATFAHIQLLIGFILYFNSPLISYFRSSFGEAIRQPQMLFFGLVHITLMTLAVVLITIGSASAKRKETDQAKFRTMAVWFAVALFIIFIAIPWPFSPLAGRPYLRLYL